MGQPGYGSALGHASRQPFDEPGVRTGDLKAPGCQLAQLSLQPVALFLGGGDDDELDNLTWNAG